MLLQLSNLCSKVLKEVSNYIILLNFSVMLVKNSLEAGLTLEKKFMCNNKIPLNDIVGKCSITVIFFKQCINFHLSPRLSRTGTLTPSFYFNFGANIYRSVEWENENETGSLALIHPPTPPNLFSRYLLGEVAECYSPPPSLSVVYSRFSDESRNCLFSWPRQALLMLCCWRDKLFYLPRDVTTALSFKTVLQPIVGQDTRITTC